MNYKYLKKTLKLSTFIVVSFLINVKVMAIAKSDLHVAELYFAQPRPVQYQNSRIYLIIKNTNKTEDFNGFVRLISTARDTLRMVSSDMEIFIIKGHSDGIWLDQKFDISGNIDLEIQILSPTKNIITNEIRKTFVLLDSDKDGIPNVDDADDDNDGLDDIFENAHNTDSLDPDSDDDGVIDSKDVFPNDPMEQKDSDKDGIGDNTDKDNDNDGLSNVEELKFGSDPFVADTDNDGLTDKEEFDLGTNPKNSDSDGDGVIDSKDDYPLDASSDADTDHDGIPDNVETKYQLDPNDGSDSDKDADADGISNVDEIKKYKTDPTLKDTDGDGLSDFTEIKYKYNPLDSADGKSDDDHDGLSNSYELNNHLDPKNPNTYVVNDKVVAVGKSLAMYVLVLISGGVILRFIKGMKTDR